MMTGSQTSGRPVPATRRRTTAVRPPDLHPAAGIFLLAGIDDVLPRLTPPAEPPTNTLRLVDGLRAALACTAACGDTCRVAEAADTVRQAAGHLLADATEEAREALLRARAILVDEPHTRR